MIGIYKPWLTWLMPRWNLAMWAFSALLILGAGLFPINAIVPIPWHWCFLAVVGVTMAITVIFTGGTRWQLLSFVTLAALALWAYHFPKIGVDYMPPLDEGSILDMPVTVPRASVTETTDDLKARDALLRRFPEVEMIVGKSGRADTPTDPSPLDMVESVITLRPKEYWPKRKLDYKDAEKQTAVVLAALQERHLIDPIPEESERRALLDPATMNATMRLDETMRELVLQRFGDFEADLGPKLLREFIAELVGRWQKAGRLLAPVGEADIDRLTAELERQFAPILSAGPGQEDINRLIQQIAEKLAAEKKVELNPELLTARFHPLRAAYLAVANVLGSEQPTLFTADVRLHRATSATSTGASKSANSTTTSFLARWPPMTAMPSRNSTSWPTRRAFGRKLRLSPRGEGTELQTLRAELDAAWSRRACGHRTTCSSGRSRKDDLLKEVDSVVRMPGWANIWTQPIINRIDMLATGVRTMIGVKVFGNDLDKIQEVSEQVAEALEQIPGAVDVFPDQSRGKGYLEIKIDRDRAARYGVKVSDVQDVIETALGGKAITTTVRGTRAIPGAGPLQPRLAPGRRGREEPAGQRGGGMTDGRKRRHGRGRPACGFAAFHRQPVQVPLAMVADVKIVEGPAMIKSENGMLRNYVQLNVRDRDVVGFVEEAQRVVAAEGQAAAGDVPRLERPVREPGPRRQNDARGLPRGDPGDLHHPLSHLQRPDRRPADDEGRARGDGRRNLSPLAVRLPFQRGRPGGIHRLLRHGHRDGHHHARLPPRRGGKARRAGEDPVAARNSATP